MTDDELAAIISANVRAARVAAEMTQRELAKACGIAFPHISRLEKGTHLPSVKTLKKVADALKVPICSLIDSPDATDEKSAKKGRKP